ncbi:isoprenylcysteine carboxylmethyltransferase family protein [Xanthomonas campestris]|nr:isoprenylcysteine carboxylmethyltransferase family protein [Xanthomonas campestris]
MCSGGIALNVLPKLTFARAGTTINPLTPQRATQLVTTGLHRYTRNPMYLGHALLLSGWIVSLQQDAALVLVGAYVLAITRLQILPEERALAAQFGPDYPAYCRVTPRWL